MAYQDSGMLELANPQLASILRQRRFAEMLMQQGADASPAQHPLQAVARVAQALLGGYSALRADDKMDEIGQKQDKDAADFMKAMQPQTTQSPLSGMPAAVAGQPTAMAPDLMQHFQVASARTGVPVPVLVAQAQQESNLNPDAVGKAGEVGVMQVHPRTARDPGFGLAPVDPATLRDPGRNIQFGADYLAARAKAQGVTDWNDPKQRAAGLTAYNGGGDPNYAQNVEARLPNAGGGPVVIGATSTVAPGADIEALNGEAARLRALARQGLTSQNPRIRALAGSLGSEADAIERRAEAERVRIEGRDFQTQNIQTQRQIAEQNRTETRALAEQTRNAGTLPVGYQRGPNGEATPIPGVPVPPNPADAQGFTQANALRDEFGKLTADFRVVQSAYENIRSAAKANDGAGDMSLLYSYVKLLDPTSVVRESEFATAAASGSFGERVQGAVNRIMSGARMPETLRDSFIREAKNLYGNQRKAHDSIADQYEGLAKRFNIDPDKVVTRFARPQEDEPAGPPPEVVSKLSENIETKFGNGQVWTLQGGKPVRVK